MLHCLVAIYNAASRGNDRIMFIYFLIYSVFDLKKSLVAIFSDKLMEQLSLALLYQQVGICKFHTQLFRQQNAQCTFAAGRHAYKY